MEEKLNRRTKNSKNSDTRLEENRGTVPRRLARAEQRSPIVAMVLVHPDVQFLCGGRVPLQLSRPGADRYTVVWRVDDPEVLMDLRHR